MGKADLIIINNRELCSKPYVIASTDIEKLLFKFYPPEELKKKEEDRICHEFSNSDFNYYISLGSNNSSNIKTRNLEIMFLFIEGRSYFENQESFYKSIASKVEQWCFEGKGIVILIKLDILNSSSRKHLKDIILRTSIQTENLNVFWISVDEEMLEEGIEMKDILGAPDYFIY